VATHSTRTSKFRQVRLLNRWIQGALHQPDIMYPLFSTALFGLSVGYQAS